MEAVVRFSLKQRVFYNLMFIMLMAAGTYALFRLPAERFPDIHIGKVIISVHFPGASPHDVETLVTHEIEEALETVKNVEWIKSTSYPERSLIQIKFIDDSDYSALYNEVRFKVLNQLKELPAEIDPPDIHELTVNDYQPVIVINLSGKYGNRALSLIADELKTTLQQVSGVQEIRITGEHQREFHVYLDPVKLKALGISYNEVAQTLIRKNFSIPAGDFADDSGEFVVKVDQRFRSREHVVSTIIRKDADGSFVQVKDLMSRAELNYRDPLVIASVNGDDSLALQIVKAEGASALEIKDAVEQVVNAFSGVAKREGVSIDLTQDSTVYIKDGLGTLGLNMLVGIILVSLIIWYFMGIRNAGLVTIGIPFSFLISMVLLYLTGNSLNEMTLFSFVLVAGIVVDDAIVVTENIYRHAQEGKGLQEAIVVGTAEVALPVISATMTTVAAFLPMLIMTGPTGEFFALIPQAVTFAIVASLFECLLVLPIHYLGFGPRTHQPNNTGMRETDNAVLHLLRILTERILRLTLCFRFTSLVAVLIAFGTAAVILGVSVTGRFPLIRIQFFPDDYVVYFIDIEGPTSTPLAEIDRRIRQIAGFVVDGKPGLASSAVGFAGFYTNEDYDRIYGGHYGSIMVTLPPKDERSFDFPLDHLETMRTELKQRFEKDGFRLHIHPQKYGPPRGKEVNVRVVGTDMKAITGLTDDLLRFLQRTQDIGPYLVELTDDRGRPKRFIRFHLRDDRISEYGLDSQAVAQLAASVLDGRYIGRYRLNDEEIDLKLYMDPSSFKTPEDAVYVSLLEHASGPIRLADLIRVEPYSEPGERHRFQGQRTITLQANIKPGSPTSTPAIVNAVKTYYESIRDRYPGASVVFAGEFEETQRSYESLSYAFILAVTVIYMILATQFQSYLQPLIVLSAIVFALTGVVFGKLVTQSLFTVNSFVAVLGVTGVVVNDALVLIDFINKRYRSGMTRRQAIEEGVHARLRPIVLTTLTTTLALLPMALGIPSYSLVWGAMASTFVTGLAAATTLTVFIVPVLWDLLQEGQERRLKGTRKLHVSGL